MYKVYMLCVCVCVCVHVCACIGACTFVCVHTCPVIEATSSISPGLAVIPWYAILRADFLVLINTSPLATLKAIYYTKCSSRHSTSPKIPNILTSMSGRTQQLVCPYMVSGRSVAATKKIGCPASPL